MWSQNRNLGCSSATSLAPLLLISKVVFTGFSNTGIHTLHQTCSWPKFNSAVSVQNNV